MGNYGGPGVISLMSGTIIPANNWMIGTATNLATPAKAPNNLYPGASWAAREDRLDHRRHVEHGPDQRAADGDPATVPADRRGGGERQRDAVLDPQPDRCGAGSGRGRPWRLSVLRKCAGDTGIRFCGSASAGPEPSRLPGLAVVQSLRHTQSDQLHQHLGPHRPQRDLGRLLRHGDRRAPRRVACTRAGSMWRSPTARSTSSRTRSPRIPGGPWAAGVLARSSARISIEPHDVGRHRPRECRGRAAPHPERRIFPSA